MAVRTARHAPESGKCHNAGDSPLLNDAVVGTWIEVCERVGVTVWTKLLGRLEDIRRQLLEAEGREGARIASARSEARDSVRNLIHYLALRQDDIRSMQTALSQLGLSSLGRCEGFVLASVDAVLQRVKEAVAAAPSTRPAALAPGWSSAEAALHANTRAIFGPKPSSRHVYIMVTAPEPDVADDAWFDRQLRAGMNVLRINTAHGTPASWAMLAERSRAATQRNASSLRILVDLPGPKVRTVAEVEGPRIVKLKPRRDAFGRVTEPCRVVFAELGARTNAEVFLPLPKPRATALMAGQTLKFCDARGKWRSILIVPDVAKGRLVGEISKTAYVGSDTRLSLTNANGEELDSFSCPDLPPKPHEVAVPVGGTGVLRRRADVTTHREGDACAFGCTLPEIFGAVEVGQRLLFDDGKIETKVVEVTEDTIAFRVERAKGGVAKIRGDMGLNVPDATLVVPAVSERDAEAIAFLERDADFVGLSFVRSVDDVRLLESMLTRKDLGLMLKIETRAGFAALPSLLLDAVGRRALAVMIARGDLAVECGFERLVEIQEEILWLCEASHVPVVWATQVLESLAKTGFPTRAEVTDAAMAVQAECVMLNKGPFIESATQVLDSILRRMEQHVYKKRQLYRPLQVALGRTR